MRDYIKGMKEYAKILSNNHTLYEVGCRNCGVGGKWKIFADNEGHFAAKCVGCGHESNFEVVEHPDIKTIELRFLV